MKKKLMYLLFFLGVFTLLSCQGKPAYASTSYLEATDMSLNQTTTGSLTNDEIECWYKLELTNEGWVEFKVDADNAFIPVVTLYDADGTTSIVSNIANKDGGIANIRKSLRTGKHYIKVSTSSAAYTGSYKISATQEVPEHGNDVEPNNSATSARTLEFNKSSGGFINSYAAKINDNEDWYRFVLPEEGWASITFEAGKGLMASASLYDSDGTSIMETRSTSVIGSSATIHRALRGGTYYVKVSSENYAFHSGSYQISVQKEDSTYGNDTEPDNTFDKAISIESGQTLGGFVNSYGGRVQDKADWYKFEVAEDKYVSLELLGDAGLPPQFNLYQSDGTTLLNSQGNDKCGSTAYIHQHLQAGQYYVSVKSYNDSNSGSYQLTLSDKTPEYGVDVEPNNEFSQAIELISGVAKEGRLGFISGNTAAQRDIQDWYLINITEACWLDVSVKADEGIQPTLFLYNADSTSVIQSVSANEKGGSTSISQALRPGLYYLRAGNVNNDDIGGYRILAQKRATEIVGDVEPNDNYAEATTFKLGDSEIKTGFIGAYGNNGTDYEDWYKISLDKDGWTSFKLETDNALQGAISLVDANGRSVVFGKSAQKFGETISLRYCLGAGDHYIKVTNSVGTGYYTLSSDQEASVYGYDSGDNATSAKAKPISVGSTVGGLIGARVNNTSDSEDWYYFNLDSESWVEFELKGDYDSNPYITVYHSENYYWGSSTSSLYGGTSYLRLKLPAGKGNVRITGSGGSYQFKTQYNGSLEGSPIIIPTNTTAKEAKVLSLGTTAIGSIVKSTDVCWYELKVENEGIVSITAKGDPNVSPSITLYDEDTETVILSNSAAAGGSIQIRDALNKGKYYLKVTSAIGNFSVTAKQEAQEYGNDAEPNNSADTAITLELDDQPYGGFINSYAAKIVDNEDWYTFVMPKEGWASINFNGGKGLMASVSLYDSDKVSVMETRSTIEIGGSLTIHRALSTGTYYIKVSAESYLYYSGGYQISVQRETPEHGNDAEPNNTFDKAIAIGSGQTLGGFVNSYGGRVQDKADWYKFEVAEDKYVSLELLGDPGLPPQLNLYQSNGTLLLNSQGNDKCGGTAYIHQHLQAGQYYISVKSYNDSNSGSYQLTLSDNTPEYGVDLEPNDEVSKAIELTSGVAKEGRLGFITGDAAGQKDIQDWYLINITEACWLDVSVNGDEGVQPTLFLYNEDYTAGIQSASANEKGGATTISQALKSGIYYIRVGNVNNDDIGGYRVAAQKRATDKVGDLELNDNYTEALTFKLGESEKKTGFIGAYGGNGTDYEDWYKISLDKDGSTSFKLETDNALQGMISLVDADGRSVVSPKSAQKYGESIDLRYCLGAGDHYIKVSSAIGAGYYTLSSSQETSVYGYDSKDNDTFAKAKPISVGSSVGGVTGARVNNTFDSEDWYYFDLEKEGYVNLELRGDNDYIPYLMFTDTPGNTYSYVTARSNFGDIAYLREPLRKGRHYVRVCQNSTVGGSYQLKVVQEGSDFGYDNETNNGVNEAISVGIGVVKNGYINTIANNTSDNEDWYKVNIGTKGVLSIELKSDEGVRIAGWLRDSAARNVNGFSAITRGEPCVSDTIVEPGTYYIVVYSSDGSGSYSMSASFLSDSLVYISGNNSILRIPSYLSSNSAIVGQAIAEPIDSATGAHVLDRNLLALNGARDLTFDIHYNSLLLNSGSLGKGWTHDYGAYLEFLDDSTVTIHWSPNRANTFNIIGQNLYTCPDQSMKNALLNKKEDGSYTLTQRDQSQFFFDPSGKMAELKNSHGQVLNLTYNDSNQLEEITEPISGQGITINYNEDSLISTISDALSQEISFTYDSSKNLTGITDATGKTSNYGYDEKGQVLTGSNPEGIPYFSNTYDDNGRVISQFDGMTGHLNGTFSYDELTQPGSLITTYTNREGQASKYYYDSEYRLIKYTDELGNSTNYIYDEDSNCTGKTFANGTTIHYTYDALGNILTYTDPAGNITTMTYDTKNNLLTSDNPEGKRITNTYDENNNLIRITDPMGNNTNYEYDANGLLLTKTTPEGNATTFTYQNGLLNTVTDPTGVAISYSYDPAGRLMSQTDALGKTTQFTHDANNNLTSITDPLGNKTSYTYDSYGNILTVTDPKGNLTQYTYNSNQKLISKLDPMNSETKFIYDGEDRLIATTDSRGNVTTITYDAKGQPVSVTDALDHTSITRYDSVGDITGKKDALNQWILDLSYDANGNPTLSTDALGQSIYREYDKLNRLNEMTNGKGQTTQYSYDDLNRITGVTDALQNTSSQGYDAEGNRVSLSDPNNNQTLFTYDDAGRILSEKTADGSEVKYSYDSRGLLTQKTNGRGQVTIYQYDDAGRMVSYTDPVGTVSITYDANGNILTIEDEIGIIAREYDSLDRVTQYTDVWGNSINYNYDSVGNLVTLTYPGNKAVNYEYDEVNRLIKVTDWADRVTNYEYDANDRLTKTIRPDGSIETRQYDVIGQLTYTEDTAVDGTVIGKYDYAYDEAGNIVTEKGTAGDDSSVTEIDQIMTYGAGNRLVTFDGQDVTYDNDGNMTNGPLDGNMGTYTYDAKNRLVGAGNLTYQYDALNNRVGVTRDGVSTRYVVNPQPALSQVLLETDQEGTPIAYYVYGLGLIGKEDAVGGYYSYHFDYRGSTTALTDQDGGVTDKYAYDAYGKVTVVEGTTPNPYMYNARDGVLSDENGLYYMRARYYSPEVKRFVNQDVVIGYVTDGRTLNRFVFVNGQPVNYVDPLGLFSYTDILKVSNINPKDIKKTGTNVLNTGFKTYTDDWVITEYYNPAAAKADVKGEYWTKINQGLRVSSNNNDSDSRTPLIGDFILNYGKNNNKVKSLIKK